MTCLDTFSKRQSVRSFTDQSVSDDLIEKLIQAANSAPVALGAYENYHLTLVTDKELMDKACNIVNPDKNLLYGAPVWLIVSTNTDSNSAYSSAAIIAHQIALAATDLGLGACHIWGLVAKISEDSDLLRELGIPDGFKPTASIAVGYPSSELSQRELVSDRINFNEVR